MVENAAYDKKTLAKYLVILALFVSFSHVTSGYAISLIPVCLIWTLIRGKLVNVLFWMLLFVFIGAGNRYFFAQNATAVLISRLCLVTVAMTLMIRVFGRRNAVIVTPFLGILVYITWEALISLQGFSPIISYLKILLFVPMFLAFYVITNEVTQSTRVNAKMVRSAILSIACLAIIGSACLIPFPAISQLAVWNAQGEIDPETARAIAEGKSLFMGMTCHSQVMGPLVGIVSTLIFGDLVFSVKKWDKLYVLLLVLCPVLLIKTSSRTALGTYLAGMGMVTLLFLHARGVAAKWRGKVVMVLVAVSVVGSVGLFSSASARESFMRFILKVDKHADIQSSDVTLDKISSSRQGAIEVSLRNFQKKPMLGNGFQVSETMENERRSGLLSYISAPIEKGVWVTATLEEGGVPGLCLFAGFLIFAIFTLIRRHAYIGASMLWVFSVANLGEFSFFTMSYIGGMYWGLVYAGVVLDGQRIKTLGLKVFKVPISVVMEEVGIDMWTKRLA